MFTNITNVFIYLKHLVISYIPNRQAFIDIPSPGLTSKDLFRAKEIQNIDDYALDLPNYDPSKPSIIILDDSEGVVSFLLDDIDILHKENRLNKDDYNILAFSTCYAAFSLVSTLKKYNITNIKYGIFDITIGGAIYNEDGNLILDGIDAAIECKKVSNNIKYVFFTGNQLNPYITKSQIILKKYNEFFNDNIHEHIVYKTSVFPDERKNAIFDILKK